MPTFESYPPGTPSWVDVASPDPAASKAFYGTLFGWEAPDLGPEAGGYAMFQKSGRNVAGIGPIMGEGQPAVWTTYVSVEDADATVDRARGAGATVVAEPMDVLDVGRMAMFADTSGAVIAVWQPKQHRGAELANETGTFCWNELQTRDPEGAKAFYRAVFDWGADSTDQGPMPYTEWKRGDSAVGGMMQMSEEAAAMMPPFWLTYFGVDDCDGAVATVAELGGTTIVPPMDIPAGRFAVVTEPSGAAFGVIRMAQ